MGLFRKKDPPAACRSCRRLRRGSKPAFLSACRAFSESRPCLSREINRGGAAYPENECPGLMIFGSSESVSTAVRVVDYDAPASVRLSTQYV